MLVYVNTFLLQMLSVMIMVFLGRISNIFKSCRWVCLQRTADTGNVMLTDPTQNKAKFFVIKKITVYMPKVFGL